MRPVSVKKLFLALLLCLCAVLSACGNTSPVTTDPALTVDGTTAGTLGTTSDGTGVPGEDVPVQTGTTPGFHAATWSLGGNVDASDETEYDITEPEELYAEQDVYLNYLSGYENEENETLGIRRVTAVCLNNNFKASRFQCGTADADVIFEIPMDYGTTMLLAMYYNPNNIPKLGAVRSAVPAAVAVAEGFDAYLLHNGYLGGAKSVMEQFGTDHIDAEVDSDCFYSDSAISYASSYAYSMFTTSARIVKSIPTLSAEGAHFVTDEIYRTPFVFREEFTKPIGNNAGRIRVFFGGFQPYFLYNSRTGLYERYQHGAPHVDTNTGETLAFENVIILFADSEYKNNHIAYNIEGFGSGLYASGGKYVNVTWTKSAPESPLIILDALGNELAINKGHTFITFTSGMSSVEIRN